MTSIIGKQALTPHIDVTAQNPIGFANELARAKAASQLQRPGAEMYSLEVQSKIDTLNGPKRDAFLGAFATASKHFGDAMMRLSQIDIAKASAPKHGPAAQALYDFVREMNIAKPIVMGLAPYTQSSYGGVDSVAGQITGILGMTLREQLYAADASKDPDALEAAKMAVKTYIDFASGFASAGATGSFWSRVPRPVDVKPLVKVGYSDRPEVGLKTRASSGPATAVLIDALESFDLHAIPGGSRHNVLFDAAKELGGWDSATAELALREIPPALAQLKLLHPRDSYLGERFRYDMYRGLVDSMAKTCRRLTDEVAKQGDAAAPALIDRTAKLINLHYDIARTVVDPWISTPDATMSELYGPSYEIGYGAFWRLASNYKGELGDVSHWPAPIREALERELEVQSVYEEIDARRTAILEQLAQTTNPNASTYREAKGYLEQKDIWVHVPDEKQAGIRAGLAKVVAAYEAQRPVTPSAPKLSQSDKVAILQAMLIGWAVRQDGDVNVNAIQEGMRQNKMFQLEMSCPELGGRGVIDAFSDILRDASAGKASLKLYETSEQVGLLSAMSRLN
jgi:hypothetical protein